MDDVSVDATVALATLMTPPSMKPWTSAPTRLIVVAAAPAALNEYMPTASATEAAATLASIVWWDVADTLSAP